MKKSRIKSFDIKIETNYGYNYKVTYLCPKPEDYFIINDAIENKKTKYKRLQKYIANKMRKAFCDNFDQVVQDKYGDFNRGGTFILDLENPKDPVIRLIDMVKVLNYISQKGYAYKIKYNENDEILSISVNGQNKF